LKLANSSQDPISKNTHHKNRAGGVAQSVGPEFKPQYLIKTTTTEMFLLYYNNGKDEVSTMCQAPSPGLYEY
jgi:hypothetical protein